MQTTNMKLGLFCPTRKRVKMLTRLMESAFNLADKPDRIKFRLYVDSDDYETMDHLTKINQDQFTAVIDKHGVRHLSDTYNVLFHYSDDDVMVQLGDDTVMRTKGWDTLIENAFLEYDDRLVLIYGRDEIHNEKFAAHYSLHRNWIETVGYASPPYFSADWSDTWTFEIAKKLGRTKFINDLIIEHLHWTQGKSEIDETTFLSESRRKNHNNESIYRSEFMIEQREKAYNLLMEKINDKT